MKTQEVIVWRRARESSSVWTEIVESYWNLGWVKGFLENLLEKSIHARWWRPRKLAHQKQGWQAELMALILKD